MLDGVRLGVAERQAILELKRELRSRYQGVRGLVRGAHWAVAR
ncbi:MAG: hypothetical protein AB1816_01995 [Bacillota bacterium]